MKIFFQWLAVSVTLSAILFLTASFGGLSFFWFLNVDSFIRFVYGVIQVFIIFWSLRCVIEVNEKAKN